MAELKFSSKLHELLYRFDTAIETLGDIKGDTHLQAFLNDDELLILDSIISGIDTLADNVYERVVKNYGD